MVIHRITPNTRPTPQSTGTGLTAYGMTDTGKVREHNEDSYAIFEPEGLFVVCDGMGGHAAGEVASDLACRTFAQAMHDSNRFAGHQLRHSTRFQRNAFEAAIHRANHAVCEASDNDRSLKGMGTTLVALQATPEAMVLGHVGDSRAYKMSPGGKLTQLTRDHSLLNQLLENGENPSTEEATSLSHILVQAIGYSGVNPDVTVTPRNEGDIFLLCSDGLTDLISREGIEGILTECGDALDLAAEMLVAAANQAGGRDNITVLIVRVDGTRPVKSTYANKDCGEVLGSNNPTREMQGFYRTRNRRFRMTAQAR